MGSSSLSLVSPIFHHLLCTSQPITNLLDIGMGESGLWGFLIRHYFDSDNFQRHFSDPKSWRIKITGIEACEGFHNPIHDYCYNELLWGDANLIIQDMPELACVPRFDVVIFSCVIEHMDKETGYNLMRNLTKHLVKGGFLIVATYNGYAPKESDDGNKYEEHKSGWVLDDFQWIYGYGYELISSQVDEFNHLIVLMRRT